MSKLISHSQSNSTHGARHTTLNTPPYCHVIAIPQPNPFSEMEANGPQLLNGSPSSCTTSAYEAGNSGRPIVSEQFSGDQNTINESKYPLPSNNSTPPVSFHTTKATENVRGQTLRQEPLPTNVVPNLFNSPMSSLSSATNRNNAECPRRNDRELQHYPLKSKKRREKPRIELAPDQPPTTQGKPRARVYVACLQCRTRKIRCDGAKPICHNCGRRTNGDNECTYDTVPKRRGPDKTPGARQRLAREVRNQLAGSLSLGSRRRRNRASSPLKLLQPARSGSSSLSPSSPESSIVLPTPLSIPLVADLGAYDSCSPIDMGVSPQYAYPCHGMSSCLRLVDTEKLVNGLYPTYPHCGPGDLSSSGVILFEDQSDTNSAHTNVLDENETKRYQDSLELVIEPSLSFARDTWWDSLLCLYMSPNSTRLPSLSLTQRDVATQGIISDLRFIFRTSNYWFSFFHIPTFFGRFFDARRRRQMQPSLVLALITMSTFWQSSEVGNGSEGRERALRFRDEAQGALEASVNAGWLDETLAQAAWLLTVFEVCAHPLHSTERSYSALVMLDSIIRSLSLTQADADHPHATTFLPGTVPVVPARDQPGNSWYGVQPLRGAGTLYLHSSSQEHSPEFGCSCKSLTLGALWPLASEHVPMWNQTPAWNDSWSEDEIRRESIRRLCWSSMVIAAGFISYTTAHQSNNPNLFIAEPSNYALLFSGESLAVLPISSKDTIWALQDRCFLLWHACIRMRADRRVPDADKAQFATRAWLEADALEAALNQHTCEIERAFIYQAREFIFNTRMTISYEFQRFIPLVTTDVNGLFHRHKAEEWLRRQAAVAELFMHGLHTITGIANNVLARRPFFVFWFMGQIARSLTLWECDSTLTIALDVCKALLPAIDYLSALWPCPEQRIRYKRQRERLINACYMAGVDLPPPPNFSLPLSSTSGTLV